MDNLTHSLVGLAASKSGLERLSPGATAVCILAANAPDSDIIALFAGGRWAFLNYHRGITHSLAGTLGLALLLPLIFHFLDRFIAKVRGRQPSTRLRGLIAASLVVSATHPFLDWTNNYGVRLLLPWSSRWFYGDLVFIIDPYLWLLLGGAGFLLTSKSKWQIGFWLAIALVLTYLVMTVGKERGLDNPFVVRALWMATLIALMVSFKLNAAQKWGSKIVLAAIVLIVLYWGGLASLHWLAVKEAWKGARAIASQSGETVTDVAAMPTLANPFHWQCVVETENTAYRFEVSLAGRRGILQGLVRHERADISNSQTVERASQDERARIFLGFARFPVARAADTDCLTQTLVQFADLRYTQPGDQRGTFSLEVPVDCPNQKEEQDREIRNKSSR